MNIHNDTMPEHESMHADASLVDEDRLSSSSEYEHEDTDFLPERVTPSDDEHRAAIRSEDLDALVVRTFNGRIVRKDLTKQLKEGANVPVYVLEYLLGMYCSVADDELVAEGLKNVKKILADNYVRPDEAEKIKSLIKEQGGNILWLKINQR